MSASRRRHHDLTSEYQQLKRHGGAFTMEPTQAGPVRVAVFSDTCGNLIQLFQPSAKPA